MKQTFSRSPRHTNSHTNIYLNKFLCEVGVIWANYKFCRVYVNIESTVGVTVEQTSERLIEFCVVYVDFQCSPPLGRESVWRYDAQPQLDIYTMRLERIIRKLCTHTYAYYSLLSFRSRSNSSRCCAVCGLYSFRENITDTWVCVCVFKKSVWEICDEIA